MTSTKKYELTDQTIKLHGRTLHRIRALIPIQKVFSDRSFLSELLTVQAGDLGGWIEHEGNLSQDGTSWVGENAKVMHSARVTEHAWVYGNATVYDNVVISGLAIVKGSAIIADDAVVDEEAVVSDSVFVCDSAVVAGQAFMWESSTARDKAVIKGTASIGGTVQMDGDVVALSGVICGVAHVNCGTITKETMLITVHPIGSRRDSVTYNGSTGTICTGCFTGDRNKFVDAVAETHGHPDGDSDSSEYAAQYKAFLDLVDAFEAASKRKTKK